MAIGEMTNNTYVLGESISFKAGAGIEKYLVSGWAKPEPTHCWTDGRTAILQFQIAGAIDGDLLLKLKCKAFVPSAGVNHQRVEVRANDRRVATWTVRQEKWHEATIPRELLTRGRLEVKLLVGQATSPHEAGLSDDKRKLGLFVTDAEVVKSQSIVFDWIGADADPIGNMLFRDGNYFRAIRKSAIGHVNKLLELGIYQELADRNLIPQHSFSDVKHSKFAAVAMTTGAYWNVFATSYVYLMLRDAAFVWLEINEYLLHRSSKERFGLIDGHYGNFAIFKNSRPMWVDTGSIMEIYESASDDGGKFNGWFGIDQFVICFVYPLLIFVLRPDLKEQTRRLMGAYPLGITHVEATKMLGQDYGLDYLSKPLRSRGSRADALLRIRSVMEQLKFNVLETTWSNYRNSEALESAVSGKYLEESEDTRFRAVLTLVRRTHIKTFIDIGSNDGLFSILCAREGLVGIATDIDDVALNRLYAFLAVHSELQITVQCIPFLSVDHNADLVLALAITHHLFLSQGLTFEQIGAVLAKNSRNALITEFMPDGLGGTPGYPDPSPNPLPKGYTLPHYLRALKKHFAHVEVVDYERPNASSRRTLIYCEKRI